MVRKRRKTKRCKENDHKANREYKDRLFIKIFEKKEDLLQLYNAVNNSDYQAADDLEITTLDTAACGIFQWTE